MVVEGCSRLMTQNLYLGTDKGAMMDPRRTRRPTIGKVTPACEIASAYARTLR